MQRDYTHSRIASAGLGIERSAFEPVALCSCDSLESLGEHYGAGLYEQEVSYLVREEWACTVNDILWRRTKLGLHLQHSAHPALEHKIAQLLGSRATAPAETENP